MTTIRSEGGHTTYYLNGKLHRSDGPSVERTDGSNEWWLNGKCHRTDGPAVEWANGTKEWWVDGKFHRKYGPAVEWANGTKEWWVNGKRHRTNGPAVEDDGCYEWFIYDKQVSKTDVEIQVFQLNLKVLLISRAINPFCEINVAKYAL